MLAQIVRHSAELGVQESTVVQVTLKGLLD